MDGLCCFKFCFFIIGLLTIEASLAHGQTSNCPGHVSKSRPPPGNQVSCVWGGQWFYIRVGGTSTFWGRGTDAVCLSTYERKKIYTGRIHGIYSGGEECFIRWTLSSCERLLRSKCPVVKGTWSSWGDWQENGDYYDCKATCGSGEIRRTRTCENGVDCDGDSVEVEMCDKKCPTTTTPISNTTDGARWTNWENWGSCSEICGKEGYQTRSRECIEGPCIGQLEKGGRTCTNKCSNNSMHIVDSEDWKFVEDCEDTHNKFRHYHLSTRVEWNVVLSERARAQAESIALDLTDRREMLGENVFTMVSPYSMPRRSFCDEAVQDWYSEARRFNYDYNINNKFSPRTKHFTQVVWNSTTDIGCGQVALTEGPTYKVIVVCQYYPPGNARGQFKSNVSPAKARRKFERRFAFWAYYPSKAIKHFFITPVQGQTWRRCEEECQKIANCHGYSWQNLECYLWPRGTRFRFTKKTEPWNTGIFIQPTVTLKLERRFFTRSSSDKLAHIASGYGREFVEFVKQRFGIDISALTDEQLYQGQPVDFGDYLFSGFVFDDKLRAVTEITHGLRKVTFYNDTHNKEIGFTVNARKDIVSRGQWTGTIRKNSFVYTGSILLPKCECENTESDVIEGSTTYPWHVDANGIASFEYAIYSDKYGHGVLHGVEIHSQAAHVELMTMKFF
ncbi:unnamed protein product [Owenia fusiformis]|uniref:SCP domain-containing protein n=1 Tax=Owenia fusiformis TaxID=6347 RepID=A0A8S4NAV3_OWEFU|nr:unnamed protein product [Owenia fusiformis]